MSWQNRGLVCPGDVSALTGPQIAALDVFHPQAGPYEAIECGAGVPPGPQGEQAIECPLYLRDNAFDRKTYRDIIEQNVYQLPETFGAEDIVIDIGAHIGLFSYAVLQRGARLVYAVEADAANCQIAARNLQHYSEQGRVVLSHAAAWRSDETESFLYASGYPMVGGESDTGGGNVIWQKKGARVPVISFDALVRQATHGEHRRQEGPKRIRLAKIHCEGAEWPVLLTARTLHLVDAICGEYHEIGGQYDNLKPPFSIGMYERFTIHELVYFLEKRNFNVTYYRYGKPDGTLTNYGLFFARRE